jgi:glycosyltransferase involved in cell wall biosynthesis
MMGPSQPAPLVSVVVPTYNRAALLRETIDSVLAQTYPAIELIVVDDGSTDHTPDMLAELAQANPERLRVIRKQNEGGTAARNTGLRAAAGDYLSVLDHDDLLLPQKIARQVALFTARPELGLVHCGYYRMDSGGGYIDIVRDLPDGDVRGPIVLGCFCWSGGPLIPRAVLEKVGLFDETIWSSDAELWMRIAFAGYEFGCVQEPLGAYRILLDSSMADVERTERMDAAILDRLFKRDDLPQVATDNCANGYFNQRFWLACRYYTIGRPADARRNLLQAFEWRPETATDRQRLFHLLVSNALDPRVGDSEKWVDTVIDGWPADHVAVVADDRDAIKAAALVGIALRAYGRRDIPAGQVALRQALRLYPALIDRPDDFARTLTDFALRLPVEPASFAQCVLASLPSEASSFETLRRKVTSDVTLAQAFREFRDGRNSPVPGRVFAAFKMRPAALGNKGVWSILLKSLARACARSHDGNMSL